jgi:hypothetical protein
MNSQDLPSPTKRFFAKALGIITMLCAALFFLSFVFVFLQVAGGVYDGPILIFVVLFLTGPPAIVCTIISLILVGPRRCKLAWISLCSFVVPFVLCIGIALGVTIWKSLEKLF